MVDKMVATPALQLADVFPPFAWTFGKVRIRRASRRNPERDVRGRGARPPFSAFLALFVRCHTRTQSAFRRARLSRFSESRSRRVFGRVLREARRTNTHHIPSASFPPSRIRAWHAGRPDALGARPEPLRRVLRDARRAVLRGRERARRRRGEKIVPGGADALDRPRVVRNSGKLREQTRVQLGRAPGRVAELRRRGGGAGRAAAAGGGDPPRAGEPREPLPRAGGAAVAAARAVRRPAGPGRGRRARRGGGREYVPGRRSGRRSGGPRLRCALEGGAAGFGGTAAALDEARREASRAGRRRGPGRISEDARDPCRCLQPREGTLRVLLPGRRRRAPR